MMARILEVVRSTAFQVCRHELDTNSHRALFESKSWTYVR